MAYSLQSGSPAGIDVASASVRGNMVVGAPATPALTVNAAAPGTGLSITAAVAGTGVYLDTTSSAAKETLYLDGKGAGDITIGGGSTGATNVANGVFLVGANIAGLANPALNVEATQSGTGLVITSHAAGGGLNCVVSSTAANENLSVLPKGAGTLTVGSATSSVSFAGAPVTGLVSLTGANATGTTLADNTGGIQIISAPHGQVNALSLGYSAPAAAGAGFTYTLQKGTANATITNYLSIYVNNVQYWIPLAAVAPT
jgi:hypothetical protein